MHPDAKLIQKYGGTTQVAKRLGKGYTPQRVNNWLDRGIPSDVKVSFPEMFMPEFIRKIKRRKTHVTQS
jgi:hypothetical protein